MHGGAKPDDYQKSAVHSCGLPKVVFVQLMNKSCMILSRIDICQLVDACGINRDRVGWSGSGGIVDPRQGPWRDRVRLTV